MIKVNGLKSCDTCKKALKWLEVERWGTAVGWDRLVNKASTTWRGLSDAEKEAATGSGAAQLLVDNPTLIKRPVFEMGDAVIVGFKADQQAALKAG